ncbi:MAG TPA: glycine zipper domain-containing protein [Mariprofundaceae bacterium]|nr:glycine zipper domain-containing protein [Mariprofundaceae bacterium]
MNKHILTTLAVLTIVAIPFSAQAGQYQERVIATTSVIGAATGAIIGSDNNRTAQGAIIGGVFGAFTGAVLSQQSPQVQRVNRTYAVVDAGPYRVHRSIVLINHRQPVNRARMYHHRPLRYATAWHQRHRNHAQVERMVHERMEQRMDRYGHQQADRSGFRFGGDD